MAITVRKNLDEITLLRSLAMLSVVGIHFLNIPQARLAVGTLGNDFFYLWQALIGYAVPCFIFISGLMVSYHKQQGSLPLGNYYKKKGQRVGIPYLLWTAGYLLLLFMLGLYTVADFKNPAKWVNWLLYGKAYMHLYYMMLIIEFYLLAPFLLKLAQKVRHSLPLALLVALGGQMVIYWFNKLYLYQHYTHLSGTYLWYWALGFMGLWVGLNYERTLEKLQQHRVLLGVGFLLTAGIHLYYKYLLQLGTGFHTFPYTLNFQFFCLFATGGLLLFCWQISQQQGVVVRFLKWIGVYSFGIYLIHPVFTYLINRYLHVANAPALLLITLCGIVAVTALSGVIVQFCEKNKYVAIAFGKWPRKQTSPK